MTLFHYPSTAAACRFLKQNDYSQNRFAGRVDYQLIYVYKGAGHYWLNNERKVLGAGNILLFRPKEPQIYSYYANEHPEILLDSFHRE